MTASTGSNDLLRPFQLERSGIRGRFVRLSDTIDYVLKAHAYPEPVGRLLGELLVLAGGLAGGLKFDGKFSLQLRGGGPVGLMVADCTNDGVMRGYASFDEEKLAAAPAADRGALLGDGVLALTVDQREAGGELSQGIVQLQGTSLVDSMLTYFRQSEQIRTGISTAVRRDPASGAWEGGAIVLQALPASGQEALEAEEAWREAMLLLHTAREEELTDPALSPDSVLFRLFHEHGVRVYDPLELRPGCSCDEERVRVMLERFSAEDLEHMRLADGSIEATCQFCSRSYGFDADTVAGLIARAAPTAH
ncbi:Hsp33 family molecular chaperone HslO [Geminicoccaceae bacterium 1502E]|nr:Hsp33 family molecular chaperone HslO [Geminicoccaceae bacterium 1502E]